MHLPNADVIVGLIVIGCVAIFAVLIAGAPAVPVAAGAVGGISGWLAKSAVDAIKGQP